MSKVPITQASVHPLVLLSIVDHFNRVNLKQRNKRVVGALLGTCQLSKGYANDENVEIVNSYAIPFEEDPSQSSIWFLDHLYHESMFDMMKKVPSKPHRSVRKRSLSAGTPQASLSAPTTSKSTRFSASTPTDPSFWSST